jgi:hypothetical protein
MMDGMAGLQSVQEPGAALVAGHRRSRGRRGSWGTGGII